MDGTGANSLIKKGEGWDFAGGKGRIFCWLFGRKGPRPCCAPDLRKLRGKNSPYLGKKGKGKKRGVKKYPSSLKATNQTKGDEPVKPQATRSFCS